MSFEELKAELFSKGGQKEDWDQLLGGGLSYEDLVPYVAGESRESPLARANQVMGAGRMIEYDCYDGRWRGQGKAVVELVSYEDESAGTLKPSTWLPAMAITATMLRKSWQLTTWCITFARVRPRSVASSCPEEIGERWCTWPDGGW